MPSKSKVCVYFHSTSLTSIASEPIDSSCSFLILSSEFAECAVGRTISATWICRDQRLSMNSCMITHATRAEEDAARAEWFAGREDRRKKRQEEAAAVERRREEVIELIKREEAKERVAKAGPT